MLFRDRKDLSSKGIKSKASFSVSKGFNLHTATTEELLPFLELPLPSQAKEFASTYQATPTTIIPTSEDAYRNNVSILQCLCHDLVSLTGTLRCLPLSTWQLCDLLTEEEIDAYITIIKSSIPWLFEETTEAGEKIQHPNTEAVIVLSLQSSLTRILKNLQVSIGASYSEYVQASSNQTDTIDEKRAKETTFIKCIGNNEHPTYGLKRPFDTTDKWTKGTSDKKVSDGKHRHYFTYKKIQRSAEETRTMPEQSEKTYFSFLSRFREPLFFFNGLEHSAGRESNMRTRRDLVQRISQIIQCDQGYLEYVLSRLSVDCLESTTSPLGYNNAGACSIRSEQMGCRILENVNKLIKERLIPEREEFGRRQNFQSRDTTPMDQQFDSYRPNPDAGDRSDDDTRQDLPDMSQQEVPQHRFDVESFKMNALLYVEFLNDKFAVPAKANMDLMSIVVELLEFTSSRRTKDDVDNHIQRLCLRRCKEQAAQGQDMLDDQTPSFLEDLDTRRSLVREFIEWKNRRYPNEDSTRDDVDEVDEDEDDVEDEYECEDEVEEEASEQEYEFNWESMSKQEVKRHMEEMKRQVSYTLRKVSNRLKIRHRPIERLTRNVILLLEYLGLASTHYLCPKCENTALSFEYKLEGKTNISALKKRLAREVWCCRCQSHVNVQSREVIKFVAISPRVAVVSILQHPELALILRAHVECLETEFADHAARARTAQSGNDDAEEVHTLYTCETHRKLTRTEVKGFITARDPDTDEEFQEHFETQTSEGIPVKYYENSEDLLFLTTLVVTDGVDVLTRETHTLWPLMIKILELEDHSNGLLTKAAVFPSWHRNYFFNAEKEATEMSSESFLAWLKEDMSRCEVLGFNALDWSTMSYVEVHTVNIGVGGDLPATSRFSSYNGASSKMSCRFCMLSKSPKLNQLVSSELETAYDILNENFYEKLMTRSNSKELKQSASFLWTTPTSIEDIQTGKMIHKNERFSKALKELCESLEKTHSPAVAKKWFNFLGNGPIEPMFQSGSNVLKAVRYSATVDLMHSLYENVINKIVTLLLVVPETPRSPVYEGEELLIWPLKKSTLTRLKIHSWEDGEAPIVPLEQSHIKADTMKSFLLVLNIILTGGFNFDYHEENMNPAVVNYGQDQNEEDSCPSTPIQHKRTRVMMAHLLGLVRLLELKSITTSEIGQLQEHIEKFITIYQENFYPPLDKLEALDDHVDGLHKAQEPDMPNHYIHELIHYPDLIRLWGPLHPFSQWATERAVGSVSKNNLSTNKVEMAVSNKVIITEQGFVFPLLLLLTGNLAIDIPRNSSENVRVLDMKTITESLTRTAYVNDIISKPEKLERYLENIPGCICTSIKSMPEDLKEQFLFDLVLELEGDEDDGIETNSGLTIGLKRLEKTQGVHELALHSKHDKKHGPFQKTVKHGEKRCNLSDLRKETQYWINHHWKDFFPECKASNKKSLHIFEQPISRSYLSRFDKNYKAKKWVRFVDSENRLRVGKVSSKGHYRLTAKIRDTLYHTVEVISIQAIPYENLKDFRSLGNLLGFEVVTAPDLDEEVTLDKALCTELVHVFKDDVLYCLNLVTFRDFIGIEEDPETDPQAKDLVLFTSRFGVFHLNNFERERFEGRSNCWDGVIGAKQTPDGETVLC